MVKTSKLFRTNERHEQINQQQNRHDAHDDVFHGSQPFTGMGVRNCDDEKENRHGDVNQILHNLLH
jgi:hypothetical protein